MASVRLKGMQPTRNNVASYPQRPWRAADPRPWVACGSREKRMRLLVFLGFIVLGILSLRGVR